MTASHVLMSEVAASLSRIMDRPVVDQTGQTEHFAGLKLDWAPDETQYAGWGPGVWARPVSDAELIARTLSRRLASRLR